MTKAIKFNLLLDKHPVRDLTDLRANFNLDDLLTAYHSQVLHRWLEVRGLSAELSQLQEITSKNELTIARALCQLFHADISEAQIQAAVHPFEFREQQRQQLEALANQQFQRNAVIKNYHAGYEQLCLDMLEKAGDYPFLKTAVDTLWSDYEPLFRVDFALFFALFIEKSPLTLFTMLANEAYRHSNLFDKEQKETAFLKIPRLNEIGKYQKDTNLTWEKVTDQKVCVTQINDASSSVKIKENDGTDEYLGTQGIGLIFDGLSFYSNSSSDYIEYELLLPVQSSYRSYAGATEGYWKDLEPKGTKCLVLKMEAGNFVRNAGKNGEELNAEAVNKEFLILDGIDYKSNNANHALLYMVI
ncbi:MAG: hypothetical protein PHH59_08580 [Methylovulum sp.]|uniref:hypothetical protein n=1 Tax=Methylovulum sp. TaxID=1916980 RepID=UPI00261F7880|nr:hypothetical protein [Methylovulum sp.]MDD2724057.1 hypothetical protein [Methylovulum sp.]MDD5123837.1 hypothetical protein [Methylovulum sp.]